MTRKIRRNDILPLGHNFSISNYKVAIGKYLHRHKNIFFYLANNADMQQMYNMI